MAISTGELIKVIERFEDRRYELEAWSRVETDYEKKEFLAAQEETMSFCIKELEELITTSINNGVIL